MMRVSEELHNCLLLQEESIKQGAERASLIWAGDVVYDPRVNLKCTQNLCTHYRKNYMCPPFTPDSKIFSEGAVRFRLALLLQVQTALEPDMTVEAMEDRFKEISLKLLDIITCLERRAFMLGLTFCMGLGSGHCKLCVKCPAGEGEGTCINPGKARPSMEAVGIDVINTAQKAGFPVNFSKEVVRATGLLYLT